MIDTWGDFLVTSKDYRQTKSLTQEAREHGIDPTRQGWLSQLFMARVREGKKTLVLGGTK